MSRSTLTRTRLFATLAARAGGRARGTAAHADVVRAVGPRHVYDRLRRQATNAGFDTRFRDGVYERIWREGAAQLGAGVTPLGGGILEITRGEARTRVWQQVVPLDDPVTLRVVLDKPLVHRLLREVGVPVPEHLEFEFADLAEAERHVASSGGAFVVKPARGSGGGDGATCGVRAPRELRRAALAATRKTDRILLERQAEGDVFRILVLDGTPIAVVRRRSPTLTGDGTRTVGELIADENHRRLLARGEEGLAPLRVDLDCLLTLARAALSLSTIAQPGQEFRVKTVTNQGRTEDAATVPLAEVEPGLLRAVRTAASVVGLQLAGVDVITTDLRRGLAETGGIVNEVNGTPALHHHALVPDRASATPVAAMVLEHLLARAERAPAADDARPVQHGNAIPRNGGFHALTLSAEDRRA